MAKTNKILIIPSWYPPDGGYFFKEHSEAVAQQGWQVDVMATRMVGARKLIKTGISALHRFTLKNENGLRVYRSVYLKIPGNERINIRRMSSHILEKYKRYQELNGPPDLILAHSVTWAGYGAYLINRSFNIPYVIVEHRSYFVWSTDYARKMVKPFYIPFFEKAYRNCSRLVLVSESLLTGLKALMPWIEEKTMVIPNMIREDMFLPPAGPRKTDPFIFIWAGRLEPVKGLDILLEALELLKARDIKSFSVRLAGRGSLKNELVQMAMNLGLEDHVKFLGRLSREEMQDEMQRANCFVLPTRFEAFGAVIIEAMASGLPVIATRSGGPDRIVTAECGLLVDIENPLQLADAMEQMINHYEKYSPEKIRSHTVAMYGQTSVMNQYNKLFNHLLKK